MKNFKFSLIAVLSVSIGIPSLTFAQQSCETVLECAQMALEEARKARQMVEEMTKIKQEINTVLGSYNKILAGEDLPTLGKRKVIKFKTTRPGILLANLTVDNPEGRSKGNGKQHTIQAQAWININGKRCAIDQSAYYVWDGHAKANATCIYYLKPGDHVLDLQHNSTNAATTRSYGNYQVIQASM